MDKKTKIKNLKITIIQSDVAWENKALNIIHFGELVSDIQTETNLIILPEMFTTGFTMKPEKFSEELNGETVNWMKSIAKSKNTTVIGSIIISDNNEYYNRLLSVDFKGNCLFYDKRHLFRMGNEHNNYSNGSERLIVDINHWKICPLICYDLRFPVWSRNKGDYDILIYIANWPETRREIWITLLMARAIENQCYVVGVNRIGVDGNAISYSGDSIVVNPKGTIISGTKPYKESVETIELSLDELTEFRQKFPVGLDADNFKIIG
ncbi:MAG: amidohydrolase [Bacteroidota bacterium]